MSKFTIDRNNISAADAQEIFRLANIIYFRQKVYEKTTWMGRPAAKCPMDMWMYQELIFALKTDLLIETGTLFGGSALFFAQLFDLIGHGKVLSVDIKLRENLVQHPRIEYVEGSSIDDDVLAKINEQVKGHKSVTVLLDSDHKADYKLKELNAYADFVTEENYLIAEDTCFDYYPAWPEYGPGPAHAVKEFLEKDDRFELDRKPEHHMITFAPMAFLKKKTT
ncbi:MAG: cephalosporin hydroxylase family protein [Acidiferrobacterales bacterium]|nr:cephalosporin hydroxylase family protein [Acidiferrobacterales bacterium]